MTLKSGFGVTQGHRNTIRFGIYYFLLTFHDNHRPVSHRFRDKRRFLSIMDNFPVFCAPAEGVTLRIGYRRRGQKQLE